MPPTSFKPRVRCTMHDRRRRRQDTSLKDAAMRSEATWRLRRRMRAGHQRLRLHAGDMNNMDIGAMMHCAPRMCARVATKAKDPRELHRLLPGQHLQGRQVWPEQGQWQAENGVLHGQWVRGWQGHRIHCLHGAEVDGFKERWWDVGWDDSWGTGQVPGRVFATWPLAAATARWACSVGGRVESTRSSVATSSCEDALLGPCTCPAMRIERVQNDKWQDVYKERSFAPGHPQFSEEARQNLARWAAKAAQGLPKIPELPSEGSGISEAQRRALQDAARRRVEQEHGMPRGYLEPPLESPWSPRWVLFADHGALGNMSTWVSLRSSTTRSWQIAKAGIQCWSGWQEWCASGLRKAERSCWTIRGRHCCGNYVSWKTSTRSPSYIQSQENLLSYGDWINACMDLKDILDFHIRRPLECCCHEVRSRTTWRPDATRATTMSRWKEDRGRRRHSICQMIFALQSCMEPRRSCAGKFWSWASRWGMNKRSEKSKDHWTQSMAWMMWVRCHGRERSTCRGWIERKTMRSLWWTSRMSWEGAW